MEKGSFRTITNSFKTEEERQQDLEVKRKLVKQQRKAIVRKKKEKKEIELKEELKREENLKALNDMFK